MKAKAGRRNRSFVRAAIRPDDAGMPLGRGRHQDGRSGARLEGEHRLRLGLGHRHDLDGLTLAVEPVELGGKLRGLDGILRQQQPRAQSGIADAAAGIDARTDEIAEMPAFRRAGEAGRIEERGEADPAPALHDGKPLADEGPVEAGQRHHVRHRRQRHEIEARHQVGLGPPLEEAARAQGAVEGDEEQEDHAGRAEMAEARQVVLPVRVHDGERLRQPLGRLVVVEDDGIEAETPGLGQGFDARRPAIDGDEDIGALLLQRPDGIDIRAVALRDPVRDMDGVVEAAGAQILRQQCGAAGAVHVVIAEDRDLLVAGDRIGEPRRRRLHVGQHMRIGHEIAQARVQKALGVVDADAPPGENAGEHVGKAMGLRDGERDRALGGIAALDPGAAEGGTGDAQEGLGQEERS